MRKFVVLALGACAFLTSPAVATATRPIDATLNNVSSYTLDAGRVNVRVGGRYFGSGDLAWSGSARVGLGAGFQAGLAFNSFEADNDDTLGNDMVVSRWNGFEFTLAKTLLSNEDGALGLQIGAETRNSKVIIKTTRVSTPDSSTVWSFAIPVAWNAWDNVQVQGTLKTALFPTRLRNSNGGVADGYGTLIGGTIGAQIDLSERLTIGGDAMAVLAGDNSITDESAATGNQVVWSASAICHATDHFDAEAFLTNSGGTSVATSMIGASGTDSVFAGLRFGYTF